MSREKLDQKQVIIDQLNLFCRKKSGFMLLSGPNGTGKTYAALRVYSRFTGYSPPCFDHDLGMFLTQAEMNIRWSSELPDVGYFLGLLQNTDLLVIDDLGTRTPSESFGDFLYAIVDSRWRENKSTIITTNLTAPAMRQKFGDAFFSRVASGISIVFEGRDRRFDREML